MRPTARRSPMCRFLMMRSEREFDAAEPLARFRQICRDSREYQGHGWGASARVGGRWLRHRSLTPIWEDSTWTAPAATDFLVLHARSAFRDTGIELDNNMPFYRDQRIFVFNGELRGVRLRLPGRIGAEKVFRLIEREDRGDLGDALGTADSILMAKSRYVRGLNVAVTDGETIHTLCRYGEDADYFTLHVLDGDRRAVCSEPLSDGWRPLANGERAQL